MIFNSATFVLFLAIVVSLYWLLPARPRMWMLLLASCTFYGFWRWEFLSVMFVSALTDYVTARAIYATPPENRRRRRWLLAFTLVVNLGLLVYFKYLYFLTNNANDALHLLGIKGGLPVFQVVLPLGISFYTFETISYTVDVYRGLIPAEKNFLNYALFVTFFPKLVAGPIQRASELLAQFKDRPRFDPDYLYHGIRRILYGLFLKVALADNISPLVDEGFSLPAAQLSALDVWTLGFLFGLQIYFDFSAYSHIALGSAKLMGISIPENFDFPYSATSFRDFWKRWHISLSSWIRDYVYLPMSGVKVARTTASGGIGGSIEKNPRAAQRTPSLFATWALMGLWHGANWTYVVWGLFHALLIFSERLLAPLRERNAFLRGEIVGWILTVPFVMLSWIFFRANDLSQAFVMLGKIFVPSNYRHLNFRENTYLILTTLFLLTLAAYFIDRGWKRFQPVNVYLAFVLNTAKYAFLVAVIFVFLRPIRQYIYFQF